MNNAGLMVKHTHRNHGGSTVSLMIAMATTGITSAVKAGKASRKESKWWRAKPKTLNQGLTSSWQVGSACSDLHLVLKMGEVEV